MSPCWLCEWDKGEPQSKLNAPQWMSSGYRQCHLNPTLRLQHTLQILSSANVLTKQRSRPPCHRGSVIYSGWVFSAVCFDQLLMHYSPSAAWSWLRPFQYVAKVRSFIKHAVHKSIAKLGLPDITSLGEYRMMNGFPQMRAKSHHMFDEVISVSYDCMYSNIQPLP